MAKLYYTLSLFILVIVSIPSYGQLEIDAEFKPRFEFRHGYTQLPNKADESAFITSQRTRLNAKYTLNENLSGYISMQDVRIWGQSAPLESNADLNVYQAWFRFAPSKNFFMKIGRQEIEYDNCKLLSISNWRQQGRTHDAAQFGYLSNDSTFTIEVNAAINQNADVKFKSLYEGPNYKSLQTAWLHKEAGNSKYSILFVNRGLQLQDTTTNYSQTFGLFTAHKFGHWNITANYYYQTGKSRSDLNIDAHWASMEAAYKISKKLKVSAGFDYLTGTSYYESAENTSTFDPLYTRRHRYFGHQDLFYVGGFNIPAGLKDFYFRIYDQLGEKWKIRLDTHAFSTEKYHFNEMMEKMDKNLGIEFDLLCSYKYSKDFTIAGGYSQFFATDTMVDIKGSGDKNELANFAYLTFDFTPHLY